MNIRKKDGSIDFKKLLIQSGLYLVLFLMLVLIVAKEPSFLSIRNFKNILTQSSVRLIIALGVAGLIVTTGTDLSVGRQVGFSAVISVTNPDRSTATFNTLLMSHSWEEKEEIKKHFGILNTLL